MGESDTEGGGVGLGGLGDDVAASGAAGDRLGPVVDAGQWCLVGCNEGVTANLPKLSFSWQCLPCDALYGMWQPGLRPSGSGWSQ